MTIKSRAEASCDIAQVTRGEFVFNGGEVRASGQAHSAAAEVKGTNLDAIRFTRIRIARWGQAQA